MEIILRSERQRVSKYTEDISMAWQNVSEGCILQSLGYISIVDSSI